MLRKITCVLLLGTALAAASYAYDIRISRLDSWELTFSCKPPRVMEILDGADLTEYTYVIYEIKNDTSQEIDFFPTFNIETDNGKVCDSAIFPNVETAIKKRFGKDILSFREIVGLIKPGETKRGMAIFKGVDPASDHLNLYVVGISGNFKVDEVEGKIVTLYRAYKLTYFRPGDAWHVALDPVTLQDSDWVWRQ